MAKVYLVYASVFFKNGSYNTILLYVFSSYKKACIYRDCKELVIKRDGADVVFGDSNIDFVCFRIASERVVNFDWSYELKELQNEEL